MRTRLYRHVKLCSSIVLCTWLCALIKICSSIVQWTWSQVYPDISTQSCHVHTILSSTHKLVMSTQQYLIITTKTAPSMDFFTKQRVLSFRGTSSLYPHQELCSHPGVHPARHSGMYSHPGPVFCDRPYAVPNIKILSNNAIIV